MSTDYCRNYGPCYICDADVIVGLAGPSNVQYYGTPFHMDCYSRMKELAVKTEVIGRVAIYTFKNGHTARIINWRPKDIPQCAPFDI